MNEPIKIIEICPSEEMAGFFVKMDNQMDYLINDEGIFKVTFSPYGTGAIESKVKIIDRDGLMNILSEAICHKS